MRQSRSKPIISSELNSSQNGAAPTDRAASITSADVAAASMPSVELPSAVITFRRNNLYEHVLPWVLSSIQDQLPGLRVLIHEAPLGASAKDIANKFKDFNSGTVGANRIIADLTTARVLSKNGTKQLLTAQSLDQVFSEAASEMLAQKFGQRYYIFPDDLQVNSPADKINRFKAEFHKVLLDIFSIAFKEKSRHPERICIFTDELISHVPFNFLDEYGVDVGNFLKGALLEVGVEPSSIVISQNLEDLAFSFDDVNDPLFDIIAAKSLLVFGDNHILQPSLLAKSAAGILGLPQNGGHEQLFKAIDKKPAKSKGKQSKYGQATEEYFDEAAISIEAVRMVVDAFSRKDARTHKDRKVDWLRFPIEHLMIDLGIAGLLQPEQCVAPEELHKPVIRKVSEALRGIR